MVPMGNGSTSSTFNTASLPYQNHQIPVNSGMSASDRSLLQPPQPPQLSTGMSPS